MSADEATCPGCGAALEVALAAGGRHYRCPACGGVVVGIALLRKKLADGAAEQIWAAGENTTCPSGPRCSFCRSAMRSAPLPSGQAAICPLCQVVWLDQGAVAALPGEQSETPSASGAFAGLRCENCGAPVSSSEDERCRYCGAALKAPVSVVVVPVDNGSNPQSSVAGGLLDALARLL